MEEQKILLATDGSKPSLTATKLAVKEAKERDALIHAITIKEKAPMTPLEKMQEDIAEEKYLKVKSRGAGVAKRYGEQNGIEVKTKEIKSGPVVAAILEYARKIDPELIVLGNAGRSGFERLALGSVAEGVVRNSEYPVMVTRTRNDEYLADIIEIARELPAPTVEEEMEKDIEKIDVSDTAMADLEIRRQLILAFGTLLAFLVPYFLFGTMTSFFPGLATSELLFGLNTAIIWVLLIFPLGWLTAILFNQYAKEYDKPREG